MAGDRRKGSSVARGTEQDGWGDPAVFLGERLLLGTSGQ